MFKPGIVLSSVFFLVVASGCGAAAVRDRASLPQHQWNSADWYAQAIDEAFEAYGAEVQQAASGRYTSEAEAEAVAASHGSARFDAHLATALHRYGLTMGGLRLYGAEHPAFVAAQELVNAPRMERLEESAALIATRVTPRTGLIEFAEATREPADLIATR